MGCSQGFDVQGQEDADVADNIISLSQGHCQPLGDDDKYVSESQYGTVPVGENIEAVGRTETELDGQGIIHNNVADLSVNGCGEAVVNNNKELTFPSPSEHPEWLAEAMTNMNKHIVTPTNDENLNLPSLPAVFYNEAVHYYAPLGGVGDEIEQNED